MLQTEYSAVLTIVVKCVEHVVESRTERNTFMMCCARLKNEMAPWRASIIHRGLGVQICAIPLMWWSERGYTCTVVVHLLRMQELALRIRHAVFMPNKYYIESFCQRGFTTMNPLYAIPWEKLNRKSSLHRLLPCMVPPPTTPKRRIFSTSNSYNF